MVPAIAFAILIVGMALALVFDRLWLDAARVELVTATEAAALAAANEIADDELLRPEGDMSTVLDNARTKAAEVAASNMVAGSPLELDTSEEGDIRFGRIVTDADTGLGKFLEIDHRPTSVVVFGGRTRQFGNPIALFFRQLTGQTSGDLLATAEASIDNRISGVRPYEGANTPAIPLAILDKHLDPKRVDTWTQQIDGRLGADDYGYNAATGEVTNTPDGIPEILIYGAKPDAKEEDVEKANCHLVDLGTGLHPAELGRQFASGWTASDLIDFGGEFRLDAGPETLDSNAILGPDERADLEDLIGRARICVLYQNPRSQRGTAGGAKVEATRLVAVRILTVREAAGKSVEILVQPAVVTTRTALVSEVGAAWSADPDVEYVTNPYIYKLFLTQ
jgi:hypothetical protein